MSIWNRKFVPYQERAKLSILNKIPHSLEGDKKFLELVLEMPTLSDHHVRLILVEASRRPTIYEDLHRIVLQHRPLSQLTKNWINPW